jgi:hypothetical protein
MMKCYLASERKEVLTEVTARMKPENFMLSEINQL